MRYLIAAALVVSPLMLNAQTVTSAQNPHLAAMQSSLTAARLMMSSASASAADRTSAATPARVSTGVVEPKLIYTVAIRRDTISVLSPGFNRRSATLSMVVGEDGKPTDLKIVESAGPDLDPEILQAVSQYRFRPATVSGQKVAMGLNLHMEIQLAQ